MEFEYKVDILNGTTERKYINASDGTWIFFEDINELTEEQKQTHIDYIKNMESKVEKELTLVKLQELDGIVSRDKEEDRIFQLNLLELKIITEDKLKYWNPEWDDIVEQKKELRKKLK